MTRKCEFIVKTWQKKGTTLYPFRDPRLETEMNGTTDRAVISECK